MRASGPEEKSCDHFGSAPVNGQLVAGAKPDLRMQVSAFDVAALNDAFRHTFIAPFWTHQYPAFGHIAADHDPSQANRGERYGVGS
jgi:hypothetical protein